MNLILPVLILIGYVVLILISREKHTGKSHEAPPEPAPEKRFAHPPMDLRLKHDPCDTCLRWAECNGIDDGCLVKKQFEAEGGYANISPDNGESHQ